MDAVVGVRCGFALLLVAGSLSCADDQDALARVGRQRLELAPFQEYVGEVTGEAWQGVNTRVAARLLDQYMDQEVVLEAARQRQVGGLSDDVRLAPTKVRHLVDELCGSPPEPATADVEAAVARRLEETRPVRAHVRQLLVDDPENALVARDRLAAGEGFVEISREVSRAPNASDGGELGFIDQGSLPPEIDSVIFSLAEGEISDPVQGPSGFHVFQVLERLPAGPPDRREVEAAVRIELTQQAARKHVRDCVGMLASEVGVEVFVQQLWFPYGGRYAEGQNDA
jgi:parvulin-like peptidyl-prolyl isomerase